MSADFDSACKVESSFGRLRLRNANHVLQWMELAQKPLVRAEHNLKWSAPEASF